MKILGFLAVCIPIGIAAFMFFGMVCHRIYMNDYFKDVRDANEKDE